jgi:hypothetical protein
VGVAAPVKPVLVISPHFPPDATAGAHRARVIAPYLEAHGWRPTVLTVDPRDYEGTLDEELAAPLPAGLDVVRCRAWSPERTRRVGLGDLGLRSLKALWRESRSIVGRVRPDAVYVTTYPTYPAVIGPWLRREFGTPFVLDLQDPWVGAWGAEVGPTGRANLKSRLSRALAVRLERYVVPRADGLTSVSSALLDELAGRYPAIRTRPRMMLPIGSDPGDAHWARTHSRAVPWIPPADGRLHICYVGTALPLGHDVLRSVFAAAAHARERAPVVGDRLRFHFIGTSNEARADAAPRVARLAALEGVGDLVSEHAPRIPFFDALRVLDRAGVVLVAGTSEARYTASKLHAALASARPILAVFHAGSDVTRVLRPLAERDSGIRLFTYDAATPVDTLVEPIAAVLAAWSITPPSGTERRGRARGRRARARARRPPGVLARPRGERAWVIGRSG